MVYSNKIEETCIFFENVHTDISYGVLDEDHIWIKITDVNNQSMESIVLTTTQVLNLSGNLLALVAHVRSREI